MRSKVAIFLIILLLSCPRWAAGGESRTVDLNTKNFVYLVFDANVQDIFYDNDNVEDERSKRKDMIGLRLLSGDTAPIGCLVVMEGGRLQHLWLRHSARIQPLVHLHTAPAAAAAPSAAEGAAGDTAAPPAPDERPLLLKRDSADTERSNSAVPAGVRAKAQALLKKPPTIVQLGGEKGRVSVLPQSIGVDATHLYLAIEAGNASNTDYYVDIQGFQVDYKRKGLAAGATGKEPLAVAASWDEPQVLRAGRRYRYVLVYELFTLKKNQSLELFIREKNGGRNVDVEVPSRYLYENTYPL